jgi:hypothetical protein
LLSGNISDSNVHFIIYSIVNKGSTLNATTFCILLMYFLIQNRWSLKLLALIHQWFYQTWWCSFGLLNIKSLSASFSLLCMLFLELDVLDNIRVVIIWLHEFINDFEKNQRNWLLILTPLKRNLCSGKRGVVWMNSFQVGKGIGFVGIL